MASNPQNESNYVRNQAIQLASDLLDIRSRATTLQNYANEAGVSFVAGTVVDPEVSAFMTYLTTIVSSLNSNGGTLTHAAARGR